MKIFCVGYNYKDTLVQNNVSIADKPVFFLKAETALVLNNKPFYYPDFSKEINYEAEIVIKICRVGKHIKEKFAHTYYNELGIGIDFTAFDLLRDCKQKGLPWEVAKSFDGAAPLSTLVPVAEFADVNNIDFSLKLNNNTVQQANTGQMLFNFDAIISHISAYFTIKTGDLIYTGTPAGIGAVVIGDKLEAFIGSRKMLECNVK